MEALDEREWLILSAYQGFAEKHWPPSRYYHNTVVFGAIKELDLTVLDVDIIKVSERLESLGLLEASPPRNGVRSYRCTERGLFFSEPKRPAAIPPRDRFSALAEHRAATAAGER